MLFIHGKRIDLRAERLSCVATALNDAYPERCGLPRAIEVALARIERDERGQALNQTQPDCR
jgi:hypothetical protein